MPSVDEARLADLSGARCHAGDKLFDFEFFLGWASGQGAGPKLLRGYPPSDLSKPIRHQGIKALNAAVAVPTDLTDFEAMKSL